MTVRRMPVDDIDIAAELRKQLDEEAGKNVRLQRERESADKRNADLARVNDELQRQVDDLQRVLCGTAEDLVEEKRTTDRGDSYWSQVAHVANQRTVKAQLRVNQLEGWLRESGQEAMRLQTERDLAREEAASATRLLDASEERVKRLEAHVARLADSVASREVD